MKQLKKCNHCHFDKPITEFHKDTRLKSGCTSWCEKCHREYHTQYYLNNQEKLIKNSKEYYYSNKEARKKNARTWAKSNPDKRKLICQKWRDCHKEQSQKSIKKWKMSNPEKVVISSQKRRALVLNADGTITEKEWTELVKKYNHSCLCCGTKENKITLDHIVPLSLGGKHTIDNVQPLCQSCNSKKYLKTTDFR